MNTNLKQDELFPPEHLLYHQNIDNSPGYFATLAKLPHENRMEHKMYPVKNMVTVVEGLNPNFDSYISQAEFFRRSRKLIHLRNIALFFVDLDVYNIPGLSHRTVPELVNVVRLYVADQEIPPPSVIMYSGRGLYLKWLLEKPIPQKAVPRWNAIQIELVDRLQDIGADPQARDASRVLRLEHTINTKTGEVARVLHVTGTERDPTRYGFDYFAEMILPLDRHKLEEERKARKEHARATVAPNNGFNRRSLAWQRLLDLRTLYTIRGGVPEGERMLNLFYRLNFLLQSQIVTSGTLYSEARAIAQEIDTSWKYREKELSTLFKKAKQAEAGKTVVFQGVQYSPLYTPRNDTLIQLFHVQRDEMQWLSTVIDATEKRRRDRERKEKQRREAGAIDRSEYLQQATDKRIQVQEMRDRGLKPKEISKQTGIHIRMIYRYLK